MNVNDLIGSHYLSEENQLNLIQRCVFISLNTSETEEIIHNRVLYYLNMLLWDNPPSDYNLRTAMAFEVGFLLSDRVFNNIVLNFNKGRVVSLNPYRDMFANASYTGLCKALELTGSQSLDVVYNNKVKKITLEELS